MGNQEMDDADLISFKKGFHGSKQVIGTSEICSTFLVPSEKLCKGQILNQILNYLFKKINKLVL